MRPTMKQLYGVDPSTLRDLPAHAYHARKIDLLLERKEKLVRVIEDTPLGSGYEAVQGINYELKYIEKALEANRADLEELNRKETA